MHFTGQAKLLRIFIGENDKLNHVPLYECIVKKARNSGLAGATVWRGMLSFGATSRIRSAKVLDLSSDLPVIIEITDQESKIDAFLPELDEMFDGCGCGGLVTMESVEIIKYTHNSGD